MGSSCEDNIKKSVWSFRARVTDDHDNPIFEMITRASQAHAERFSHIDYQKIVECPVVSLEGAGGSGKTDCPLRDKLSLPPRLRGAVAQAMRGIPADPQLVPGLPVGPVNGHLQSLPDHAFI